jgi:hypothetical protein
MFRVKETGAVLEPSRRNLKAVKKGLSVLGGFFLSVMKKK